MTEHQDVLAKLNQHMPLREKLVYAHQVASQSLPFIARIAITLYDPETRVLKTYLHSSGEENPLEHYQASLDDAPSLKEVLKQGAPRVINNMLTFENGEHEHTQRLARQGYAASYTLPIFDGGQFIGFIFFNSYETDVFSEKVLRELDLFGHLIALMVLNELATLRVVTAAVKTTGQLTHMRDPETGSHLDRMSRYSRLIAATLSQHYELDDGYIEHIFMFAPLHDIGKIAIPDEILAFSSGAVCLEILMKPDKLDAAETAVMRTHAQRGRQMIDQIIANFGFDGIDYIDVLRNIAAYHHEAINGSGYPEGKSGKAIPLEARIVAVADVFDALTSRRCYKAPWDNDKAFATLRQLAGEKLDQDCVAALLENRAKVEAIQRQFSEDPYG